MVDGHMRREVIAMYSGPSWKKKVMKMSDGQVFAIYKKHQAKLEKEKLDAKKPKTDDNPDIPF